MTGPYEKYNITRLAATGVIVANATNMWGVVLTAPTNDADLKIYDDPDSANGTVLLDVSVLNGSSVMINLTDFGGRGAAQGLWGVLTGTNAIAYVWYSK